MEAKPVGFVAMIRSYIAALVSFILFFLQSLINPDAASKQNAERRRPGGGGGSGFGGGGRGGPRIVGVDKISGGSHGERLAVYTLVQVSACMTNSTTPCNAAAQCGGGG